jgi:hypothetical protein
MRLIPVGLAAAVVVTVAGAGTAARAGPWGTWFHRQDGPPCTLAEVGSLIEAADREIRGAGTIVIKQPDVWGQDRMTSFRRDFDVRLRGELDRFQPVISARVGREDSAEVMTQGSFVAGLPALAPTTPASASPPAFTPAGDAGINLEPTVALDEKKRFLDHGYELLRVNRGDDTADAAGYGLYLFRLPVSIDPAGATCKGWGGQLTVTVRHEFGPSFLPETFRNLVINDLVDLLAPIVAELIRSDGWRPRLAAFEESAYRYRLSNFAPAQRDAMCACIQQLRLPIAPTRLWKGYYPIASADLTNVLLVESFYRIAAEVQDRLHTTAPRGSDVRALLRQELEVAYDLMRGDEARPGPLADIGLIEGIGHQIEARHFEGRPGAPPLCLVAPGEVVPGGNPLVPSYRLLMGRLPGNLEQRALGALAWAIATEAGLLNRQIRKDMWRLGGTKSFACPANLQDLYFYGPMPTPGADHAFRTYVEARWPLIALGLDPVTDQQNVADAYRRSRDLQLALTAAFAAGKMGASSLTKVLRQVRYDAESFTLNRTVTAFAHGPDTFGWRFYPRYQAPRDDPSTLHALTEAIAGGFDPYKLARLEPGQRELTAVVIVPSFLRQVRVETASHWFRLNNPAVQRDDATAMLEQGRRLVQLRQGLAGACDAAQYRPDDVTRLATRIDQLERMLPLQTHVLGLPYDHTLGGFELFTQGAMSLVPELVGYEGVEGIDPSRPTDLLILGKHLSLSGTRVIVSGVSVPEEVIDFISRHALRVHLPAGLSPTVALASGADSTPAFEVFVITPGGTSNRLVVPCVASIAAPLALAPPTPAPRKLEQMRIPGLSPIPPPLPPAGRSPLAPPAPFPAPVVLPPAFSVLRPSGSSELIFP